MAYASRRLLDQETRYYVPEKELLAVVFALLKWIIFLLSRDFVVLTDHRSLQYLNTTRLLSSRITRWVLVIQEYSFEVKYLLGKENFVPDILAGTPCLVFLQQKIDVLKFQDI